MYSVVRTSGIKDYEFSHISLAVLLCVEAAVFLFIAMQEKGCGGLQQTAYIPAFLSVPDHIGRKLINGGQCQILSVHNNVQIVYESIRVIPITANSLRGILSDFGFH